MRIRRKSCSSTSSEISMLLGLQDFDFSTVTDDPCTARSNSKKTRVKVTSCGSGSFTCNDGQCVSINERCNQISNCRFYLLSQMCQKTFGHFARDESDEENCKMLVRKSPKILFLQAKLSRKAEFCFLKEDFWNIIKQLFCNFPGVLQVVRQHDTHESSCF